MRFIAKNPKGVLKLCAIRTERNGPEIVRTAHDSWAFLANMCKNPEGPKASGKPHPERQIHECKMQTLSTYRSNLQRSGRATKTLLLRNETVQNNFQLIHGVRCKIHCRGASWHPVGALREKNHRFVVTKRFGLVLRIRFFLLHSVGNHCLHVLPGHSAVSQ